MEIEAILLVALVSVLAGLVNTLVGGGTTIILPLLVALKIEPQLANASNRFAVCIQAIAALWTFYRASQKSKAQSNPPAAHSDTNFKSFIVGSCILVVIGGVTGAICNTILPKERLADWMGYFIVGGLLLMLVPKKKRKPSEAVPAGEEKGLGLVGGIAIFLCGVYGGFLGAGVGIVIMLFLPRLIPFHLQNVVILKVVFVFLLSAASAATYALSGLVSLEIAAPIIVGYVIGGVLGAKVTLSSSEKGLRYIVVIVGILLAIKVFLIDE